MECPHKTWKSNMCVFKCPYVDLLCSSENGFDTSHGMHGPEPALSVWPPWETKESGKVREEEKEKEKERLEC